MIVCTMSRALFSDDKAREDEICSSKNVMLEHGSSPVLV